MLVPPVHLGVHCGTRAHSSSAGAPRTASVPSRCTEDMMVSGRRSPVRALIGWRMLLFAGASRGAYERGGNPLARRSDDRLLWSTRRGRANTPTTMSRAAPASANARGSGGMADAHGSGPCARKGVRVQLPPSPPQSPARWRVGLLPFPAALVGRPGPVWSVGRLGFPAVARPDRDTPTPARRAPGPGQVGRSGSNA